MIAETTYSQEQLVDMINSGDPQKIQDAQVYLERVSTQTSSEVDNEFVEQNAQKTSDNQNAQPPEAQPTATEQPEQNNTTPVQEVNNAVSQQVDPKTYSFNFHGEEINISDNDGFLGFKDLDGLKKSKAHQNKFIEELICIEPSSAG